MKLLELFKMLSGLKDIPRVGWSLAGIGKTEVEDVAQHSFDVVFISLLLAEKMRKQGIQLKLEKVLLMASIHDWSEAITGDVACPAVEYFQNEKIKEEMESRAAHEIFNDHQEILRAWKEFTENKTPEARVVKAADYLSILVQAVRYMERGYRSERFEELWKNVARDLTSLAAEFPQIREIMDHLENEKRLFKQPF